MKAFLENIPNHSSITAFSFETSFFEFKWHYHPEYELTLITKGKGMRMVGDSYENFKTGDLILLGPGIPHTWMSKPNNKYLVSATVIQFSTVFILNFKELVEFNQVQKLLQLSTRGLSFNSINNDQIAEKIKNLESLSGVKQISELLLLLDDLVKIDYTVLASSYYAPKINAQNENRINIIFDYIKFNIQNKIELSGAAAKINLTNGAFCKFFKRMTGKTFSDYVNDERVGNACFLLVETDKTIIQIALEIGFDNQTYFNRVFLKKKNCTPKKYRMQFNDKF